ANLLADFDADSLAVEPNFPVLLADIMRSRGFAIEPDRDLFVSERRRKTPAEIEALTRAQARAERAVSDAVEILTESHIADDSLLYRGVPLTAERLRGELVARLAGDDYLAESMIIAPGPGSSDPHWEGTGPIRPHQPIILDIFPQDRQSRYHGDVTRTVVKGEASPQVTRMFTSVEKAHAVAIGMIRAGVNGHDVHLAVQASFVADGYGEDGPHAARFTHGTGHGLGLEVHELPRISRIDMELLEGDVVTVEPGLYDPAIGGVRLEDVVVVTSDGHRNLNSLPKTLVVP
ncbi:MAG TPA: Xaa-Pro peptidase family protein, partial [Chloroflexota bacterium]|nr:Xaa-Pro peptidase family protein [Chloroflexota bacterium]